mmetsp:Transcript_1674/g.3805  ORF Transcript_1674/g.3805 Transcript_1674/m.3805 type:complete len:433 (-) Transcript_1674:97-1395(-)
MTMGSISVQIFLLVLAVGTFSTSTLRPTEAFSSPASTSSSSFRSSSILLPSSVPSSSRLCLTPLPQDISPFTKSSAKARDVQGDFRKIAEKALVQALKDGKTQLELEFPPLLGGDQSKTQFDDFDNVQELNQNRDWCVQLLPSFASIQTSWNKNNKNKNIWFILPDLKEVELCKEEWTGQRYRQAATYSIIEAVTSHYSDKTKGKTSTTAAAGSGDDEGYSKPWGATFAGAMNQLLGGSEGDSGLLGNANALDSLDVGSADDNNDADGSGGPSLHLVCQPGNGGPVEDWINVKAIHDMSSDLAASTGSDPIPTCVVNGALDKVRDGCYAPFIFPKLAKTFDFYRDFEAVFFLKPVSDKGVYGWLFRVYPEPWQVVLQRPVRDPKNEKQILIQDIVALTSDTKRPTYSECVNALLKQDAECSQQDAKAAASRR